MGWASPCSNVLYPILQVQQRRFFCCVSWQVPAQAHVVPIEAVFASDTTILEKLCKVHNMYIHSVVFAGSSSP
jgi:hypothetical protein